MDEIQLEFGRVIREVQANYGGNMTAFLVAAMRHSKTEPLGQQQFWISGIPTAKVDLLIELCKVTLDLLIADNQCSPLEAMKILEGKILERKFSRDRQVRESRGRR